MDLPPQEIELREVPDFTMPLLQVALLRRSMDRYADDYERCDHCQRTPLSGERMFVCSPGRIVCELCIDREPDIPREPQLVHGPEFGHTIRIMDRRAPAPRPRPRLRPRPAA